MTKIGRYCKAYPARRLRQFSGWTEKVPPMMCAQADDADIPSNDTASTALESDGYYFLQGDYTVTAGIFLDRDVAFDQVSEEWKEFCSNALQFTPELESGAAQSE